MLMLAPCFDGKTESCIVLMLVDTGSVVTIIRTEVWENLLPSTEHKLCPTTQAVVAASGKGLDLSGQVELPYRGVEGEAHVFSGKRSYTRVSSRI